MAKKASSVPVQSNFETMFKPPIKCEIINADKLDMTPEEFELIKTRSKKALDSLCIQDPDILDRSTTE